MEKQKQSLFNYLSSLQIQTETKTHKISKTCEEWTLNTKDLFDSKQNIILCKNLFLKSKTKTPQIYLIIANQNTSVDLKKLCKTFKVPSGKLRFASDQTLLETLGCEKGAVTPLALYITKTGEDKEMQKKASQIIVVIEKDLFKGEDILLGFHPLTNDQTTLMSSKDFAKFVDSLPNTKIIHDFSNN